MKLAMRGQGQSLTRSFPQVLEQTLVLFRKMDLEFSLECKGTPGKSKCLVTFRSLRQALLGPLIRLGIATAKEIGYLGVDLCRSGGRNVKAGKRTQGLRKRVSRMVQLGLNAKRGKVRQGMRKVVRAGLMAGFKVWHQNQRRWTYAPAAIQAAVGQGAG
jgi:hypothetical protein